MSAFRIADDQHAIEDLRRRLAEVRWSDAVVPDWSQGTELRFLAELVEFWRTRYDWERRRAELNRLPHHWTRIDGFGLHYLHFLSSDGRGVPLLLMNGWPSSFVEYQRLAPLLVDGAPAFDVVIPTHPGFGFSDKPSRPYEVEPADLYPALMTSLGYDRFLVAGTDVGSGIATRMALAYPDRVLGLHVSAVAPKAEPAGGRTCTQADTDYSRSLQAWARDEGGYQALQSSKPQTLAFALADSPVGLASWIVEKFHGWTDCDGDLLSVWPMEALIDNLMIYWLTNTIGSSVRYYYDATRLRPPLAADAYVRAPTAVAMWPKDLALAPREVAERLYDVRRYTVFDRGGHFPAWEAPEFYAEELRRLALESLG